MTTGDHGTITSRLFGPLGAALNQVVPKTPVFFLALDPFSSSVRFYRTQAGRGAPDPKLGIRIAENFTTEGAATVDDAICRLILQLSQAGASQETLYRWALHTLDTQMAPLGEGSSRLRLQDALDALAYGLDSLKQAGGETTRDYRLLPGGTVLRVPQYVERPGLVVPSTCPTFVAEYVYWLGAQNATTLRRTGGLDFYFLPLRGLGQWRASADWIESTVRADQMSERLQCATPGLRACLEALYSVSILDVFLLSAFRSQHAAVGPTHVEEAFKSLWWAREVALFERGQFRRGFSRDGAEMRPQGEDNLPLVGEFVPSDGAFLSSSLLDDCPRHTKLVLSIDELASVAPDVRPEVVDTIRRLLGFDQVQYACPYIDREEIDRGRWALQLGERVARMGETLAAAAKAERTDVYESIGHTLKTAVQVTGWRGWHRRLRELAQEATDARTVNQLNGAANALALFGLAEGLGGLVRLVGILDDDEKLRGLQNRDRWVQEAEVEEWLSGKAENVVWKYFATLRQLSRVVCLGVGWPHVHIRLHQASGDFVEHHWEYDPVAEPHEALDVSSLAMPPLREGTDGVFAVLPSLMEPLRNAATALDRDRPRGLPALRIEVMGNLPRSVEVLVGNVLAAGQEPPMGLPPGLRTTAALLKLAGVASFREPMVEETPTGERIFWIGVEIHPVDLALRILGRKPQQEKGQ